MIPMSDLKSDLRWRQGAITLESASASFKVHGTLISIDTDDDEMMAEL